MTTTEDRLRHALDTEASTVESATTWPEVSGRLAARRRTRRLRQATLSAIAAAAVVAGVLAAVSTDDDGSSLRVVPPATQPTVPTVPTTASPTTVRPTIPPEAPPASMFAETDSGSINEIATIDGRVLRTIASSESHDRFSAPADRSALYYATTRGGEPIIVRFDVATGTHRDVVVGIHPEVSPDGRRLAYVPWYVDASPSSSYRLTVQDLRTGAKMHWDAPPPIEGQRPPTIITKISWAPDSRLLAISEGWESDVDVAVFDTTTQDTFRRPHILPTDRTSTYDHPVFTPDGSIIVECNDDDDSGSPTPNRIVEVDAESGTIRRTLISDVLGSPLDLDESGRHLLYYRFDPATESTQLYRWTAGTSTPIARQYTEAVW